MDWSLVTTFAGALLAVLNPLGGTPLYLASTAEDGPGLRREVAALVALCVFAMLVVFFFVGGGILAFLGISIAAFRIGGGTLLLLMGLDMARQPLARTAATREQHTRVAAGFAAARLRLRDLFVPIVVPVLVGPGSLSTTILYGGQASGWRTKLAMVGVILGVAGVVYVCLASANLLRRAMGDTGMAIASRLLGIVLTALAAQLLISGLAEAFPALQHAP